MENISLNKFENIEAKNIGLSDSLGILKLNISENGYDAWNTFANDNPDNYFQHTVNVNVSTLDIELMDIDKTRITLVKIDVEGWEKFVLNGAATFLSDYSPILMVEFTETEYIHCWDLVQDIYDMLHVQGYKWYTYKDDKLLPAKKEIALSHENLIACRDVSLIRKRCKWQNKN